MGILKVAVVGAGQGTSHGKVFAEMIDEAEVVAVCDLNPAKAKECASLLGVADTTTDYAVIDGNVANMTDLAITAWPFGSHGELRIDGDLETADYITMQKGVHLYLNGTATIGGTFTLQENNTLLGGSGTIDCANLVWIRNYGSCIIAPGDNAVGTLSFIGGGELQLENDSIYEWEIGPDATDTIDITGGTLNLDDFVMKILDAGAYVSDATNRLPVFTYSGLVPDMAGFGNDANNFDTSALTIGTGHNEWKVTTLSLTNVVADSTIYLTGLTKPVPPPSGAVLIIR